MKSKLWSCFRLKARITLVLSTLMQCAAELKFKAICMATQLRGNIDCKQTLIFYQSVRVRFRQKELGWFVVNSIMKLKKVCEKLIQIVTIFNIRETLYSIFIALVCRSIGLPYFYELWHIWQLFQI